MSESDASAGREVPADAGGCVTTPGVYEIPASVYHADPVPGGSLSSTGARKILSKCPAVFNYERQHGAKSTPAMDFGTIAHRVVLGEDPMVSVIEWENYRTGKAQDARDAAVEAGRMPILAREWMVVLAMAKALQSHPLAGGLLSPGAGKIEQSLFWRDELTGVNRRARLDLMRYTNTGRLIGVDYKTTADASLDGISKSVLNYGYHQQAAWYRSGMRELGLSDNPGFLFVFQEKTAPYVVTVVELTDVTHRIGRARNRQALEIYARCEESGYWPGYDDGVALLGLPAWAEINELKEIQ